MTMTAIQHIELTSSQSSITFSSIPQTYTDLYLVLSLRGTQGQLNGGQAFNLRFNGSSTGYTGRRLDGNGTSPTSTQTEFILLAASTYTANTFGSGGVYIPNYRSANYKSFSVDSVGENNATYSDQSIVAGLWSNTDAITSITLSNTYIGIIDTFSSATLYGILAGSDGTTTVS